VVWGGCENDRLALRLEMLGGTGRSEVIQLPSIDAQTSKLDLERAARLVRTAILYLSEQHAEAAQGLVILAAEAGTSEESAELTFLRAASLLFTEQYEAAIAAYTSTLSYKPLLAQTYNNQGVAELNLALDLSYFKGEKQADEVIRQAAIEHLTLAAENATDAETKATALANRGAAFYYFLRKEEFDRALGDCEQAVALAPQDAMGYVCRAAIRIAERATRGCGQPFDATPIRDDLIVAQRIHPERPDVYHWRGLLADLQSMCEENTEEGRKHQQESMENYKQSGQLMHQQSSKLATDRWLIETAPANQ
jgi:tetratricopeptide (TPR) repeat protein